MKYLSFIILSFFSFISIANATSITPAQQCQTLPCIRQNIDLIDSQLVTLLGERFANVQRAGELKKQTVRAIHDTARENKILIAVQKQAQQQGYPALAIRHVFEAILAQANSYERNPKKVPS